MSEPELEALGGTRKLKRWLRPLMLIVAAAFVAATAIDLSRRWDSRGVELELGYAALSLVPVLAGVLIQGFAWILLVERMSGKATPRLRALGLYFDSQLARYTPGKVGLPLVRMHGAPSIGLPPRVVGASVLVEVLSWMATGAVIGFLLLGIFGTEQSGVSGLAGRWAWPLLLGSTLALGALVAVDRARLPERARNLIGLGGGGPVAPLRLPALQLVYWTTWAAHGFLLTLSLGATPREALETMAFSPLANVLGFAALAAPAGVGVREAVLIAGLSPVVGGPGAIAGAVLGRALSLLADFAAWLLVRGLLRREAVPVQREP